MADVWANSMACHPRATCHTAGCWHLANSMSSFQSYVSHCRVLPLGEFTVTIPEPHATLQMQGSVTWRNQCHDRATLQGVRIPSAILKIVLRHIFFWFLMHFRLWRAAAFASSPIHLFWSVFVTYSIWDHRLPSRYNVIIIGLTICYLQMMLLFLPHLLKVFNGCLIFALTSPFLITWCLMSLNHNAL